MATFGQTTPGTTISAAVGADRKVAFAWFMPEDGTITDLSLELQNDGTDVQAVRAGLYVAVAGTINTLVASSPTLLLAPGMVRSWTTFTLSNSYLAASGQAVYPTIHFGTTGGNAKYWLADGATNQRFQATDIFSDGLSNPWGTTNLNDNIAAMYGSYTPASVTATGIHAFYSNAAARLYAGVP